MRFVYIYYIFAEGVTSQRQSTEFTKKYLKQKYKKELKVFVNTHHSYLCISVVLDIELP